MTRFDYDAIVAEFGNITRRIEKRGVPASDAGDVAGDVLCRLVTAQPAQPFATPRQMWRYVWTVTDRMVQDYWRKEFCGETPPTVYASALVYEPLTFDDYREPIDPCLATLINALDDDQRVTLLSKALLGIQPGTLARQRGEPPRIRWNAMRNARNKLRRAMRA